MTATTIIEKSLLGEVSWILLGPVGSSLKEYMGGLCSGLPTTSFATPPTGNILVQGYDLRLKVYTPQIQIPNRLSSTSTLDYRIDLFIDDSFDFAFGVRCGSQVGWARAKNKRGNDGHSSEVYYNTSDLGTSKVEYYTLNNFEDNGTKFRSKTAVQFRKTGDDSYVAHMTMTTYDLDNSKYEGVGRYIVKSNGTSMKVYQFGTEDDYPDNETSFTTCNAPLCTSYCFTQAGVATSSNCPSIGSGDEIESPLALSTLSDFSTESIDAGMETGEEWPDLTPMVSSTEGFNSVGPKLSLSNKEMLVGASYSTSTPAFDINDANSGQDKTVKATP